MTRKLYAVVILAIFLGSPLHICAQQQERTELKVEGLKPGSGENASPAIKKFLEKYAGNKNIKMVLPGGRLDMWPEGSFSKELYLSNATEDDSSAKVKNIAFLLEEFQDLHIEGNNTLVVLHGKMVSFAIINSNNISISRLSFDMERPTMSEMTIESITPDSVLASIHPDSKYEINKGKIRFYGEGWDTKQYHTIAFNPISQTMKYSSFKPFEQGFASAIRPGLVLFKGSFKNTALTPGDVLTIRDPFRDNCGAFIALSRNVSLDRLNMHYMHGLGIVAQFSEDLRYTNVRVAPSKGSGRIISSFADCFHFSGCRGKILIDSCFTSGSHDDPINVHGTHLKIVSIGNNGKMVVRFMHHQTYGFPAFFKDDSIAFVNPETLKPIGYGKLASSTMKDLREMEITVKDPVDPVIPVGTVIENLTWTPELTIRNSHFERTNTRGILVTTRKKVLIENNVFSKTGMHAILIANDASSWYESGPVTDVTIRNNRFYRCGYNSTPGYAISIAPENHQFVDHFFVHRNIRIENNSFVVEGQPVLNARSVSRLIFRNNSLSGKTYNPGLIRLEACEQAVILKNRYIPGLSPSLELVNMKSSELKTDQLTNNAMFPDYPKK